MAGFVFGLLIFVRLALATAQENGQLHQVIPLVTLICPENRLSTVLYEKVPISVHLSYQTNKGS